VSVEDFRAAVETKVKTRPQRAKSVPQKLLEDLQWITEPKYTAAADARAGGCHSSAVLGPGAYLSGNSDSDPRLPSAIDRARDTYGIGFFSGHLLNAELGGDGKNTRNLTILTPAANSAHKGFDDNVKFAVAELKKAYTQLTRLGIDVRKLKYGIRVDVKTVDTVWADTYPGLCISNGLECEAEVVGVPDPDALAADVADRDTKVLDAIEAMDLVTKFVLKANANGDVDNSQPL
jgi:hypothetical protein